METRQRADNSWPKNQPIKNGKGLIIAPPSTAVLYDNFIYGKFNSINQTRASQFTVMMVKDCVLRRSILSKMTFMARGKGTKDKVKEKTKRPLGVGHALKEVLCQASATGRLVTGTIDCASVLKRDPEKILLCILPEAEDTDFFMQTHNKLVEAYCRENDIKLVKVDCGKKLTSLIPAGATSRSCDNEWTNGSGCMVVTRPQTLSKEEDFVITYHDTVLYCEICPVPLIAIPE